MVILRCWNYGFKKVQAPLCLTFRIKRCLEVTIEIVDLVVGSRIVEMSIERLIRMIGLNFL